MKTNVTKCKYVKILWLLMLTHTHLQRNDYHEDLFFVVRQDVFNKSPASSNQCQCDEQESPLKSVKYNITIFRNIEKL